MQLQKVNSRLDDMEEKVADVTSSRVSRTDSKLSTGYKSCHKRVSNNHSDVDSIHDQIIPSLSVMRSNSNIQRQIDTRTRELDYEHQDTGNELGKIKFKKGVLWMFW